MVKINQYGKISFSRAVKDFFIGYFDFSGRTTRAGFWFVSLFLLIIFGPLAMLFAATQIVLQTISISSINPVFFNPFLYFGGLLSLGMIFPMFALLTRRMRDTGMKDYSTFLFLILFVILKGGDFVTRFQSNVAIDFSFFILTFFFLVAFFVFSLLPTDYFSRAEIDINSPSTAGREPNLQGWSVTKQGKVLK